MDQRDTRSIAKRHGRNSDYAQNGRYVLLTSDHVCTVAYPRGYTTLFVAIGTNEQSVVDIHEVSIGERFFEKAVSFVRRNTVFALS